jgi:hypothetical protein
MYEWPKINLQKINVKNIHGGEIKIDFIKNAHERCITAC